MQAPVKAVLHLVDTLEFGGAERAAVDYVNHLPRDRFRAFLCTTRKSGPLEERLRPDVTVLHLGRRHTLDTEGPRRLARFVREHKIQLLHAHGSTLFLARVVQYLTPAKPALIWHLHYGRWAEEDRRDWRYALLSRDVDAIVTSSDRLADWVARRFPPFSGRVAHMPNMVTGESGAASSPDLPGQPGSRIVNVANLRPEKDHLTLLRAFALVSSRFPQAHLILVGRKSAPGVVRAVEEEICRLGLGDKVSLVGERSDVPAVLARCDVGVLSSSSEGLPLSLLEYGMAGLPTVSTSVGQCPEVLDHGSAGLLAPPKCPEKLAEALEAFLGSAELRRSAGERLRQRVETLYGPVPVAEKLCSLYEDVLAPSKSLRTA